MPDFTSDNEARSAGYQDGQTTLRAEVRRGGHPQPVRSLSTVQDWTGHYFTSGFAPNTYCAGFREGWNDACAATPTRRPR